MPYRKVTYTEQLWYLLRWKFKEVFHLPRRPKRPCSYPGCPKLTDGRFCEEHAKVEAQRYERYERDPATKRRYGRAWKRIRDKYVQQHPFCELCYKKGQLVEIGRAHV